MYCSYFQHILKQIKIFLILELFETELIEDSNMLEHSILTIIGFK